MATLTDYIINNRKPISDPEKDELKKFILSMGYEVKQLGENVFEVVKQTNFPSGEYLNPIPFTLGMAVTKTLWYYADDKDLPHEAIASGIPSDFYDSAYFDYVE